MQETPETLIRNFNKDDTAFVFQSWLKDYRRNSQFAKRIRSSDFFQYHHKILERIFERETSQTLIACDPETPKVIWGYITIEKVPGLDLIHYIYVKDSFRGYGIGGKLLKESGFSPNKIIYTHETYWLKNVVEKYKKARYIPYLI